MTASDGQGVGKQGLQNFRLFTATDEKQLQSLLGLRKNACASGVGLMGLPIAFEHRRTIYSPAKWPRTPYSLWDPKAGGMGVGGYTTAAIAWTPA